MEMGWLLCGLTNEKSIPIPITQPTPPRSRPVPARATIGYEGRHRRRCRLGLVHHQICAAANVHDLRVIDQLLHGKEKHVFADSGYRGIAKWCRRKRVRWSSAMTPGRRKALHPSKPLDALIDRAEQLKASIRAKVQHPFWFIKQQFGLVKARYRGLAKNATQMTTLFMLSNL